MEDPDLKIIENICKNMIGKKIKLFAKFDKNMINLCELIDINNSIGCILQSIMFNIFQKNINTFESGPKQKSPDFINRKIFEYELKCFEKNPNFDISAYVCFVNQLIKNYGLQRKLYTKYLIFEYILDTNFIIIKNVYIKNIWNLINYSGKYPISVQNKKNIWYNIRPSCKNNWNDLNKTPKLFIKKMIQSIQQCPNLQNKNNILKNIIEQYKEMKNELN
jgi:hypothetical protein